jgi:hypothetical protein
MFTKQSATQSLNNITNNSQTQAQSSCTQLPGGRGGGRPTNAEKALRLKKNYKCLNQFRLVQVPIRT